MTMEQEEALLGKKYPVINLGGREFKVSLTFNSLVQIEAMTGKSFLNQAAWIGNVRIKDVNALVYCSVKRFSPDVTKNDIGSSLVMTNMKDCIERCMEALQGGADTLPPLELSPAETRRRLTEQKHRLTLVRA
jgi:hypothetical protein